MSVNKQKNNNNLNSTLKTLPSKSLIIEALKKNNIIHSNNNINEVTLNIIDNIIEEYRQKLNNNLSNNQSQFNITREEILKDIVNKFSNLIKNFNSLSNVINATGIIIHTNLGRAPLISIENNNLLNKYCNLEYNIHSGERNSRDFHFKNLLIKILNCEDVICVNNNAAAILLIASTFAKNKTILVRRSESVEIGEGFRIVEMMKIAGANIIDVGTTNSCNISDYQNSLTPDCQIAAKIHTSNYYIEGYTNFIDDKEFINFCKKYNLISYYDLGSGILDDKIINSHLIKNEPTVKYALNVGFDLVSFSGDKLLGGPQVGIICGKKELITKLRQNHLYRALRTSKNIIYYLNQTLLTYLLGQTLNLPTIKMLNETYNDVKIRCEKIFQKILVNENFKIINNKNILNIKIEDTYSQVGGGALPNKKLLNSAIFIRLTKHTPKLITLEYIAQKMRTFKYHIIGYIDSNAYIINPRTIFDDEIDKIVKALNDLFIEILNNINSKK